MAGDGVTVGGWLLALVPVMFSYSGWNAAAYVAEEIREPSRRLPRALALGTAIVVIVYLAMNAFYLHVLPMATLKALELRVIDAAAERLFAGAAAGALNGLSVLITAGTISAMVFAGPRVYYAMARDGLFLPAAARVHPRWRTPVVSIAAQGVWSAILGAVGDVLAAGQLHGFRHRPVRRDRRGRRCSCCGGASPMRARPFRAWGYPLAPALFTAMSAAMVVNAVWRDPGPSAAGLVVIGCGVPIYYLLRGRSAAS